MPAKAVRAGGLQGKHVQRVESGRFCHRAQFSCHALAMKPHLLQSVSTL
jgi:hypothetical protein